MKIEHLDWEITACDWCGSLEVEQVFDGPDRLENMPGIFHMARCKNCGIFRQNPRLSWVSLQKYYPENYAPYQYAIPRNHFQDTLRRYGSWKRLKAIERFQPDGRLLEIGCGTGGFLREVVSSRHWEVAGVEPSETAASYAQNTLKVPIFPGRFSDVELEPESFDAIVLWCVLEHLNHPVQDLRYAYTLLKEKGWLFFSIPNYEGPEAKIFGKYWAGWDLPRHLYIFPRPVLREVLRDIGFRTAAERCISTSYDILGHSLNFWSQSWEGRFPERKRFLMRSYRSTLTRAALVIPLAILDRLSLTSTITIFAQKS